MYEVYDTKKLQKASQEFLAKKLAEKVVLEMKRQENVIPMLPKGFVEAQRARVWKGR